MSFFREGNYLIESKDPDRRSGTVFNAYSMRFYNYFVSGTGRITSKDNLPPTVFSLIERFTKFEVG